MDENLGLIREKKTMLYNKKYRWITFIKYFFCTRLVMNGILMQSIQMLYFSLRILNKASILIHAFIYDTV